MQGININSIIQGQKGTDAKAVGSLIKGQKNGLSGAGLKIGQSSEFDSLLSQLGMGENAEGIGSEFSAEELTKLLGEVGSEGEAATEGLSKEGQKLLSKLLGTEVQVDGESLVDANGKVVEMDAEAIQKLIEQRMVEAQGSQNPQNIQVPNKLNIENNGKKANVQLAGNEFVNNKNMMKKNTKAINAAKVAKIGNASSGKNISGMSKYGNEFQKLNNNILQFKTEHNSEFHPSESVSGENKTELATLFGSKQGQVESGLGESQANAKVLDLSGIDSSNKQGLIDKITNHIEQNRLSNTDSLDLTVRHEELGDIKILAQKGDSANRVNLEIKTTTTAGQNFFVENEASLIKSLTQNGIKLSDVKIVSNLESGSTKSDSGQFSGEQGKGQQFSGQQRGGSNQSQSDRRRELWEHAKSQADDRQSA